MAIQRILVPTSGRYSPNDPENLDRPAIQAGLRVAELFKARLDVLNVIESEQTIGPAWMGWLPGYSIDPLLNEIARQGRVRRKHARSAFDTVVKDRPDGPQAEFTEAEGSIPDIVGAFGRLSDLIVLANSEARWGMPKRPILETVLWQTGRPALVVPQSTTIGGLEKIHIAWNNSASSARALQDALPMLARSGVEVTVVTCAEQGNAGPHDPERVCRYLADHGVKAAARVLEASGHRSAANTVADFAKAEGCDLLVLGSVVHMRAHSLVFGSLTHRVLSRPEMPVLLCP